MGVPLKKLEQEVSDFIQSTSQSFQDARNLGRQERKNLIVDSLLQLVRRFGTMAYDFNLAIERYVERLYSTIHLFLPEILEEYRVEDVYECSDFTDISFATYYALSLIYKKDGDMDMLEKLIEEHDESLAQLYPLAYEVQSRFYKRRHQYPEALKKDELAIRLLRFEGIENYALGISYASTVCRMYEQGHDVRQSQWNAAKEYIDRAIAYNPDYPKYLFLRGKLTFYSHRSTQDLTVFKASCEKAMACADEAQRLQHLLKGKHMQGEMGEYQRLIDDIRNELARREEEILPFLSVSEAELQRQIDEVLTASDELYCRPTNPNLKPGQEFVFVSYSHADFRSVYCDLLRLYQENICFQYDGKLSTGEDWVDEVHRYICREECVGVLFYISKNTPLSAAIERECQLLREQNGSKFCISVNLEGRKPPTQILLESIAELGVSKYLEMNVTGQRITNYLTTFHDDITYIAKPTQDGPNGSKHIPYLIQELIRKVPSLQFTTSNPENVCL